MKNNLENLNRLADLLGQRALEMKDDEDARWWLHVASMKLRDAVTSLSSSPGGHLGDAQLADVIRALDCLSRASLQVHGTNGTRTGVPPGPLPMKPTPEIIAWAMENFSEEEALAGIKEIRETGGYKLEDFIHELEKAAGCDE